MHIVLMQGGLTCRSKAVNALTNNFPKLIFIVFAIATVLRLLTVIGMETLNFNRPIFSSNSSMRTVGIEQILDEIVEGIIKGLVGALPIIITLRATRMWAISLCRIFVFSAGLKTALRHVP